VSKPLFQKIFVVAAMAWAAGCAQMQVRPNSTSSTQANNGGPIEKLTTSTEDVVPVEPVMYFRGTKLTNANFDLPVEMNPAVEKWIDYFTGRGRDRFEKYLERSEYFIPFIQPILRSSKAPEDLVYLAMIESGFNNHARSRVAAVGAWQFMAWTGRRYGLEVDWWIDERRDVFKSTVSAVHYLKELYTMFNSWPLVAAAYNAGEGKVDRAIRKFHTADYWALCKHKYLRPETRNYVPKLYAAAIIAKNRKLFGFQESYLKPQEAKLIRENSKVSGRSATAGEDADIAKLPDQLDDPKADAAAHSAGEAASDAQAMKDAKEEEDLLAEDSVETLLKTLPNPASMRTPHVNNNGDAFGDVLTEIEVPSPADLFRVSKAAGLSYAEFKSMNPHLLRWVTPPTQSSIKVKVPLQNKDQFTKTYFASNFDRDVDFLKYKVRRGDNVKTIARRFKLNPEPVAEMNNLKANSSVQAGRMLELPIPSDYVRSLASLKDLDLVDPPSPKHHSRRSRRRKSNNQSVNWIAPCKSECTTFA